MLVTFYHFKSNFLEVLIWNFKTSFTLAVLFLDGLTRQMYKAFTDRLNSVRFQHFRHPRKTKTIILHVSSKVHFCSTESQTFYWSILIADDSIECRCMNSGMTGQVGSFQNPGVCLQVFPSFLHHLPPALLLGHFSCGIWLSFLTLYS